MVLTLTSKSEYHNKRHSYRKEKMFPHLFDVDLLCKTSHESVRVPGWNPNKHQSPKLNQSRTQAFRSITSTLLINDQSLFVPIPLRAELAPLEESRTHAVQRAIHVYSLKRSFKQEHFCHHILNYSSSETWITFSPTEHFRSYWTECESCSFPSNIRRL